MQIDNIDDDEEAPELLLLTGDNNDSSDSTRKYLAPCPVTILSGFLGSGKTTLIQYILRSPHHGKRIAVIENEFGGGNEGLSVESMIASDGAQSLSDLIELPNGCICCTVKDDLVTTLENLLDKRQDLDYILIESSGMANPGPIASIFWLDDALDSRLRLDGIVTLVDANNIEKQLKETVEASQQIAYADKLLINKIDLVSEEKQDKVLNLIRTITTAPIRKTTYAKIPDLDWILDSKSFSNSIETEWMDDRTSKSTTQSSLSYNGIPFCLPITPHKHTSGVSTISFSHSGSVDLKKIHSWFATLLWPDQDKEDKILRAQLESKSSAPSTLEKNTNMELFRMKGILSVKHTSVDEEDEQYADTNGIDSRRFIVQAVYDLWEIHPGSQNLNWEENDERISKIILIGRHLDKNLLWQGFESCLT